MSQTTLAQLVKVNPCAHALILAYARNHPHDRYTDVDHAQALLQAEGQAYPRNTITASFCDMELCGLGRAFFQMGQHGAGRGFHWAVLPLVALEALRTGTLPRLETAPADESLDPEANDETPHSLPVHRFRLRPDNTVRLDLPDDLTSEEARRLAIFIKSLVREDGWPYATCDDDLAGNDDDDGDDIEDFDDDELDVKEVQTCLDDCNIVDEFGDLDEPSAPGPEMPPSTGF